MISTSPPTKGRTNKVKQYNLVVTIYADRNQSGSGLSTNVFGPYDTLEECREAGKEAKAEFVGFIGSLVYTCVPTYRKKYV